MKKINGLSSITDTYDTFILDQWGVIHNGDDAFGFAVETLEYLKDHDKKVVILSNSGKTRFCSYDRLSESGVSRDLYMDVLTSGDHMRSNFMSGKFDRLGKNTLFFPWDNDFSILQELSLTAVSPDDAQFVLCAGVDRMEVEAYLEDLEIALEKGLELIVTNPDIVAMTGDGVLKTCPGAIAQAYAQMGGVVHWHGKPQTELYSMCKDLVGGWDKAVAVGDSLEHDVAGANIAGISSLFIESGIHNQDLRSKSLSDLANDFEAVPTYTTEWFSV